MSSGSARKNSDIIYKYTNMANIIKTSSALIFHNKNESTSKKNKEFRRFIA